MFFRKMTTTNVLVCIHIHIALFIIILKDTTPTSWSITGDHSEQHHIDLSGRSKQTTPGKYPQSLTEPEGVKGVGFSFNLSPAYYMFLFMHLCLSAFLCPDARSHISLSPPSLHLFFHSSFILHSDSTQLCRIIAGSRSSCGPSVWVCVREYALISVCC